MRMCDPEGKMADKLDGIAHHNAAGEYSLYDMSRGHRFTGTGSLHTHRHAAAVRGTFDAERRNRGAEAEFWAQPGGPGKPEGKVIEEARGHCFSPGGEVHTARDRVRKPSHPSPLKLSYSRQMLIEKSFPKTRWNEMGCLLNGTEAEEARTTARSSARSSWGQPTGERVSARSSARDSARSGEDSARGWSARQQQQQRERQQQGERSEQDSTRFGGRSTERSGGAAGVTSRSVLSEELTILRSKKQDMEQRLALIEQSLRPSPPVRSGR